MAERTIQTRDDLLVLPEISTPGDRTIEKKRIRRQLILNAIRENGPLSRADVTRELGFNSQTVKTTVTQMVQEGLVIEQDEPSESAIGRPPTPCVLNEQAAMVMGLALEREMAYCDLVNLGGNEIASHSERMPAFSSPMARAGWAADFASRCLPKTWDKVPPLCGVAVGVLQTVEIQNAAESAIVIPPSGSPEALIMRKVQKALNVPVIVDSLAHMRAFNSLWQGAGRNLSSFLFFNVDETLSMSFVNNHRLMRGFLGHAGELGGMPIGLPEVVSGRMDEICSEFGLMRQAQQSGIQVKTPDELADKAMEGDEKAVKIFNDFADSLAYVIEIAIRMLNPQGVIIGGSTARLAKAFEPRLRTNLEESISPNVLMQTDIEMQAPQSNPGAKHAAITALHHIFSPVQFDIEDVL